MALRPISTRTVSLSGATLVGLLAASHAAADVPFSAISALLPMLQARFDLTESAVAVLVATLSLSASATQPLFGVLADRLGARLVGAAGVVASSALLALVGAAPSLWIVAGLLVAGGLGSAAMHPAFISAARRHAAGRPSLAVSIYSASGTLGVAFGPVAVLAIMSAFGLAGTPWLMVPGVALGIATYLFVPSEPTARSASGPRFAGKLLLGPIGGLTCAVALAAVSSVAFGAAVPLWLVTEHGVARDAPLIGWTLSAFALSAAAGGVIGGAVSSRVSRRLAVPGAMLAAAAPLASVLAVEPGSALYYVSVMAAGALLNASLPIAVVIAQDLAPGSVATVSGMLVGLAHGIAGLLYLPLGALQQVAGVGNALVATYVLLIPAAAVAFVVLTRVAATGRSGAGHDRDSTARAGDAVVTPCPCPA